MFVVKNDDGRNDHKRYKSIYFNYFFTCYYRVRLFLAMQGRVMAACMESQADILECTASEQSSRREVTVCFSPMSMELHVSQASHLNEPNKLLEKTIPFSQIITSSRN